jgi:CRISPR/Cas system-associated exonuclease Cas4 (RecB family)
MEILPEKSPAQKIYDQWYGFKTSKQERWPVHSNRASMLGDPCVRRLVYSRTMWDQAAMFPPEMTIRFEEGKEQERWVEKQLREAGVVLVEGQKSFFWKEYQIGGRIEGIIVSDSKRFPYEIKSMSPSMYAKIGSFEDMKRAKEHYLQKYPAQIQIYLLHENENQGIYIMKDKSSGMLRILDATLDYEYAESLLQKAEVINQHVKDGTLPIQTDEVEMCLDCAYRHICLPTLGSGVINFEISSIIEPLMDRIKELQSQLDAMNYKDVEAEIKAKKKTIMAVAGSATMIPLTKGIVFIREKTRSAFESKESSWSEIEFQEN